MTAWTVFVTRGQLEAGAHLEFYEDGSNSKDPVPALSAGDGLRLRFPSDHKAGVVIDPNESAGVIEVDGFRWSVRRASPSERHFSSPRGMSTVEWIIGARTP